MVASRIRARRRARRSRPAHRTEPHRRAGGPRGSELRRRGRLGHGAAAGRRLRRLPRRLPDRLGQQRRRAVRVHERRTARRTVRAVELAHAQPERAGHLQSGPARVPGGVVRHPRQPQPVPGLGAHRPLRRRRHAAVPDQRFLHRRSRRRGQRRAGDGRGVLRTPRSASSSPTTRSDRPRPTSSRRWSTSAATSSVVLWRCRWTTTGSASRASPTTPATTPSWWRGACSTTRLGPAPCTCARSRPRPARSVRCVKSPRAPPSTCRRSNTTTPTATSSSPGTPSRASGAARWRPTARPSAVHRSSPTTTRPTTGSACPTTRSRTPTSPSSTGAAPRTSARRCRRPACPTPRSR